jgi:hypothetical protein
VCVRSSEIYYYQERHVHTQLLNHVLHIKHIDLCRHDPTRYLLQCFMLIVVIDLSSTFDSIVVSMYNLLFMFMIYFWIKIKLKVLLFSTNSYQTKDKWIYENDDAGLLMEFLWSVMALDGGLTLRSLQSIVMSPDIVEVVVLGASLRFIGLGAYADDKGAMCFWEECCLGCGV